MPHLAHVAICVPDLDVAIDWYVDALGLRVLSPPYRMDGDAIERDMGELVPSPVVVRAAILGDDVSDHVVELIEYPDAPGEDLRRAARVFDHGITHVGIVCDDVEAARARAVERGAAPLTTDVADVAGVRTAWIRDPFGVVVILVQKRRADRPYWRQHEPRRARRAVRAAGLAVRDATAEDVPAILGIYNDVLLTTTAIWRDEPERLEDRQRWFAAKQAAGWPVLVAELGGAVVGFTSFGPFRDWPGYEPTVEHSIHVSAGHRGAGIGQALLDGVIERARAMGKRVLVAGVDGGNEGSIRFHERNGFREVARMPAIGVKHGQPLDLLLLQREL